MGKAYDEIMEKIEVTPEMRQRVLERIESEKIVPARPRVMRFPAWKKYLSAAACLVLVLTGAAVLPRLMEWQRPEPPVLTVPDIEEAGSLQELSKLVGFEVTEDFALPFAAQEAVYCSYWNEMAQIQYTGTGQTATYRQSLGTDDNSGDHNTYGGTVEITVDNRTVTLKGTNGAYVLAIWTDGTYSYSLSISAGFSTEDWRTIL